MQCPNKLPGEQCIIGAKANHNLSVYALKQALTVIQFLPRELFPDKCVELLMSCNVVILKDRNQVGECRNTVAFGSEVEGPYGLIE